MLSNEARELLVKAYEKIGNAHDVAEIFSVDTSTVYRISRQKRNLGTIELKTKNCGRKPSLTNENLRQISEIIEESPDITIDEIIEKLDLSVCNETVRKAVIKMGYVYKKKSLHASERERSRCSPEEG